MYYSLTFSYERPETPLYFEFNNRTYRRKNIKNTWIDWHLVPTERPSIENPEVKTKTVEIPFSMVFVFCILPILNFSITLL